MLRAIEVTIDINGIITPNEPLAVTGRRRAILTILDEAPVENDAMDCALMSEPALARYWSAPGEDEAWAHLKNLPDLGEDA